MEEDNKRIIDWRDSKNKSSPKPSSSPWVGTPGRSISIDDYIKSKKNKRTYESSLDSYRGGSSYFSGRGYYGESSYYHTRPTFSSIYGDYFGSRTKTLSADETSKFEGVLKEAIKLTKEFISILDLPFRVALFFDNGKEEFCPYENTKQLFIPTSIFDDAKERSNEELINTTVGLGIHEAAHMLYTEIRVYEEVYTKFWGKEKVDSKDKAIQALKILLFNLIEDERVDECLLSSRPGYREFIDAAKSYKLESASKGQDIKRIVKIIFNDYGPSISSRQKGVIELLIQLIYLVRYPTLLNDDYVKEHKEFFLDIRSDLDNNPKRTLDSVILSEKLVKKLIEYIYKKDSDFNIAGIEGWLARLNKDSIFFNLFTSEVLYGKDKIIKENLGDGLNHSIRSIGKPLKSKKVMSDDFQINLLQLLGSIEKGDEDRILFWKNCKGDKKDYIKIAKDVSKYCPQIRNKIKQVEKNEPIRYFGCRQGTLDTTKLVEALQGVPQVYFRTGEIKTNKVSVAILVDESGSMSWGIDGGCGHSRISISRDAAILLNESLSSIPGIDLYIYGHSADEGSTSREVDIRIYKEPGFPFDYSLTNLKARYENRDGDAIFNVAKRIRKFTEEPILFFVISDGDPLANSYYGTPAVKDTANKIRLAEKLGFEIIQVQIGDGNISNIKMMFNKYIILKNDLSQLPEKLGSILKKSILERKKTTISF